MGVTICTNCKAPLVEMGKPCPACGSGNVTIQPDPAPVTSTVFAPIVLRATHVSAGSTVQATATVGPPPEPPKEVVGTGSIQWPGPSVDGSGTVDELTVQVPVPAGSTPAARLEWHLWALIHAAKRVAIELDHDGYCLVESEHLKRLLDFLKRDEEELRKGTDGKIL